MFARVLLLPFRRFVFENVNLLKLLEMLSLGVAPTTLAPFSISFPDHELLLMTSTNERNVEVSLMSHI